MTPQEYRLAIAELGLSQNAAGRFFDVGEVTGRRWAALHGNGPPGPVAKFIRYMLAKGLTPATVDRWVTPRPVVIVETKRQVR